MKLLASAIAILVLTACGESYTDPSGRSISKEEHERRVARDALINLLAECKSNPQPGCPVIR